MKKTILTAWVLIVPMAYLFAVTDSVVAPIINFTGNKIISSVKTTIENSTSDPIEFTFPDFPQTDSQFMAEYILSKITDPLDTPKAQLEIVNAAAYFLKSPKRYTNNALIFGGQWLDQQLFTKEHSLIGRIFSTTSTQCGNSSEHGRMICLASGYFTPSDFRHTGLPNHAFIETKINGSFALTDYDVGTCVFMVKNPNAPNGWASFPDINADTSLITEKYLEDGIDLRPDQDLYDYKVTMAAPNYNTGVFPWNDREVINGTFILPPHSKMSYTINQDICFMDTTSPLVAFHYQRIRSAVEQYLLAADTGICYPCIDTFEVHRLALFSGDTILASKFFGGSDEGIVCFYNGLLDQGKQIEQMIDYQENRDSVPNILLEIEQVLDTLIIGTDLKMPLFVLEADSGVTVGDTAIVQKSVFPLWNPDTASNVLTFKEVNYLEWGMILPIGSTNMKLSWNANILDPFSKWNISSNASGLIVSRELTETVLPSLDTVASVATVLQESVILYPNPANDQVYVLGGNHISQIAVFNLLGEVILEVNGRVVDCSRVQGGTYIVEMVIDGKRVTKKLIVVH